MFKTIIDLSEFLISTTQQLKHNLFLNVSARNSPFFKNHGCFTTWCGGWDLNPRRPTPADLKSAPFVQLGHPRQLCFLLSKSYFCFLLVAVCFFWLVGMSKAILLFSCLFVFILRRLWTYFWVSDLGVTCWLLA